MDKILQASTSLATAIKLVREWYPNSPLHIEVGMWSFVSCDEPFSYKIWVANKSKSYHGGSIYDALVSCYRDLD